MEIIKKDRDWGGDGNNPPLSGAQVQKFIKDTFDKKIGIIWYNGEKYLAFADEESKEKYISDQDDTLILGEFDAPRAYNLYIKLESEVYNTILYNKLEDVNLHFGFNVKGSEGYTNEPVTIRYSFKCDGAEETYSEVVYANAGDDNYTYVKRNIKKYLKAGTNTVKITITGNESLVTAHKQLTYVVVDLSVKFGDNFNFAHVYSIGEQITIPYTITAVDKADIKWYIDDEELKDVKPQEYGSNTNYERFSISEPGLHSISCRAYKYINEDTYYSNWEYVNIFVNPSEPEVGLKTSFYNNNKIIDIEQYITYNLQISTYVPNNNTNNLLEIKIGDSIITSMFIQNEMVYTIPLFTDLIGEQILDFYINKEKKHSQTVNIKENPFVIEDTAKENLIFLFKAEGRTNDSENKSVWEYKNFDVSLEGFDWSSTSGWNKNVLEINPGSKVNIDIKELSSSTIFPGLEGDIITGYTAEFEFSTKNITNENEAICKMGNDTNGIKIYPNKVSITQGNSIDSFFKENDSIRVSLVANPNYNNKPVLFIYLNGIVSRAIEGDFSNKLPSDIRSFNITAGEVGDPTCYISLKEIRIYDIALSEQQILNNYISSRESSLEMYDINNRNLPWKSGSIDPLNVGANIPVMVIIGDVPTLEGASNTDTSISVTINYHHPDSSMNFKMEKAQMKIQGTSSITYPKKNFRIYSNKDDNTKLFDFNNNVIDNNLYSFVKNTSSNKRAQPVDCWCLKADYAESSGTHNTGIARLWNDLLYNTQLKYSFTNSNGDIEKEKSCEGYPFRTNAQKVANEYNYEYDVRTTIDGFPILLFYKLSDSDPLVFIGKYNFNNDKSTESVFGFVNPKDDKGENIIDFGHKAMQCWEIKHNTEKLALFTPGVSKEEFDEYFNNNVTKVFESRYNYNGGNHTTELKEFVKKITYITKEDFVTEKWNCLDVYKVAAYWIYLNRFAAADQFVKNAMLTSEDGKKWYFILYDNDTINGINNNGEIIIPPDSDRNTKYTAGDPNDPDSSDYRGGYMFAGHDSRLWNMLEDDEEFKRIVSVVDNALYNQGLKYSNVIDMFDHKQAGEWVESVYNLDADYKYLSPYIEGNNKLHMLHGNRSIHRRWWLSKRFEIYDSLYVSGEYKSKDISLKYDGFSNDPNICMKVTSGSPVYYGFGKNNDPYETGVLLQPSETYTFLHKLNETDNGNGYVTAMGDVLHIYAAPQISALDLSSNASLLLEIDFSNSVSSIGENKLTKLVLGKEGITNEQLQNINGLNTITNLEYLDVRGFKALKGLSLKELRYLKELYAQDTNLSSITLPEDGNLEKVVFPNTLTTLTLNGLSKLYEEGIEGLNFQKLETINITNCPNINSYKFIAEWIRANNTNSSAGLTWNNINWEVDEDQLKDIIAFKNNRAVLKPCDLKGTITITGSIKKDTFLNLLECFGNNILGKDSSLRFESKSNISFLDIDENISINAGDCVEFTSWNFPTSDNAKIKFELSSNLMDEDKNPYVDIHYRVSENDPWTNFHPGEYTSIPNTITYWKITFEETDKYNKDLDYKITYTYNRFGQTIQSYITAKIYNLTYPDSESSINGDVLIKGENTYTITGYYNGHYTTEWTITGDAENYVTLTNEANNCTLERNDSWNDSLNIMVAGELKVGVIRNFDGKVVANLTKKVQVVNNNVIITEESNNPLWRSLKNNNHTTDDTNKGYLTEENVQSVTFNNFWLNLTNVETFLEFKYFTSVNSFDNMSNYYGLKKLQLPNNNFTVNATCNTETEYHFDSLEDYFKVTWETWKNNDNVYVKNERLTNEVTIPDTVTTLHQGSLRLFNIIDLNQVTKIERSVHHFNGADYTIKRGEYVAEIDKRAFEDLNNGSGDYDITNVVIENSECTFRFFDCISRKHGLGFTFEGKTSDIPHNYPKLLNENTNVYFKSYYEGGKYNQHNIYFSYEGNDHLENTTMKAIINNAGNIPNKTIYKLEDLITLYAKLNLKTNYSGNLGITLDDEFNKIPMNKDDYYFKIPNNDVIIHQFTFAPDYNTWTIPIKDLVKLQDGVWEIDMDEKIIYIVAPNTDDVTKINYYLSSEVPNEDYIFGVIYITETCAFMMPNWPLILWLQHGSNTYWCDFTELDDITKCTYFISTDLAEQIYCKFIFPEEGIASADNEGELKLLNNGSYIIDKLFKYIDEKIEEDSLYASTIENLIKYISKTNSSEPDYQNISAIEYFYAWYTLGKYNVRFDKWNFPLVIGSINESIIFAENDSYLADGFGSPIISSTLNSTLITGIVWSDDDKKYRLNPLLGLYDLVPPDGWWPYLITKLFI